MAATKRRTNNSATLKIVPPDPKEREKVIEEQRHALVREKITGLVINEIERLTLMGRTVSDSGLDPKGRCLAAECGYPEGPITTKMYEEMYYYNTLGGRVVDALPDECYAQEPEVYEDDDPAKLTPFEEDWLKVRANHPHLWDVMRRADRMSGYARYGGVLMGLKGNTAPDQAPDTSYGGPSKLLFLMPAGEAEMPVVTSETDGNSARFGWPTQYQVTVGDPLGEHSLVNVHWQRVIHLADNLGAGVGVYGHSRLERPFYRLLDLRKILASSAEMFWKGAFPGIAFETLAELAGRSNMSKATLAAEVALYDKGLQKYMALDGVHANQLKVNLADPNPAALLQVKMISADADIPEKVLLGSQSSSVAGQDDTLRWQSKVRGRRTNMCVPNQVLVLAKRLVEVGVCRAPTKPLKVWWPEADLQSPKDQADVSVKMTQALLQYVTSGAELVMPVQFFLTEILRMPQHTVEAILRLTGKAPKTQSAWKDPKANGSGAGKADKSAARGGTSRNGNAKR